jgi:hypothetical protein
MGVEDVCFGDVGGRMWRSGWFYFFHCCVSSEDITLSIDLSPRFGVFSVIRSSVGLHGMMPWYDELQCDFWNESTPTQRSCNHTVESMEIME